MPIADMKAYYKEHQRKRYERLKAEGRCIQCGAPKNGDTRILCTPCREYHNRMQLMKYYERRARERIEKGETNHEG